MTTRRASRPIDIDAAVAMVDDGMTCNSALQGPNPAVEMFAQPGNLFAPFGDGTRWRTRCP